MTQTVVMAMNPLEPSTWERHDVDDALGFIVDRLRAWPSTARLYDGAVCASRDVTPQDESDLKRLEELEGPLYVVDYPGDPITALIVAVVAVGALAAAAFLFRPKLQGGGAQGSANNELSARTNEARIGGRVPDIFGRVRAYPDLIAAPYKFFLNNQEVEQSYMCVGRGAYALEQVRDGETLLQSIAGASASFWGPNTSPNSGDPPFMSVGTPVTDPVRAVRKMNDVNGQTLRPPNAANIRGDEDVRFVYPDTIQRSGSDIDFTERFSAGDSVTIGSASYDGGTPGILSITANARFEDGGTVRFEAYDPTADFSVGQFVTLSNATYSGPNDSSGTTFVDLYGTYEVAAVGSTTLQLVAPEAVNAAWGQLVEYPSDRTAYKVAVVSRPDETGGVDLAGTYTLLSVTAGQMVLSNPVTVNAAWGAPLQSLPGSATPYISPYISKTGVSWVGPFVVNLDDLDTVLSNIVAASGLFYTTKKGKQRAMMAGVEVELVPLDDDDVPTGPAETFSGSFSGSADNRDAIGFSLWAEPTFTGRCSIRARRTTPTDLDEDHTVVDEIKWRDCYGLARAAPDHFGDVTTVMTRTYGTAGATSLKERKLSVVATRRLPQRLTDGSFSEELYPTKAMADIAAFMCTDPKIGRRPLSQVDLDQLYQTQADIEAHFGTEEAAQFCHTFDQLDTSFGDTLATLATACFSSAYRRGSLIRLTFERPTEDSALLFNHRNKMPGTESRTLTLGTEEEFDGVALEYADPRDGARVTLYVPQGDESASNPKKVTTAGVSSHLQAHFLAWRAWNRIRHQSLITEFDALPEADLLALSDRVMVADNTRPDARDGEVVSQDVLKLRLSQPSYLEVGVDYTILLQGDQVGVDAMAVYPVADEEDADYGDPYVVMLERAPAVDLALGDDLDFRSTYAIVGPGFERTAQPFLLSEKEPQDDGTIKVVMANYDARYYANDRDHIDGLI